LGHDGPVPTKLLAGNRPERNASEPPH
jgi:hypothetical protein